jgi:hypothetical protein
VLVDLPLTPFVRVTTIPSDFYQTQPISDFIPLFFNSFLKMLDLDAYIAHYTGATRLERLSIIAQSTSDAAVSAQAFALLEQQCKQDGNVMKYKEIFMGTENDDSERQAAGKSQW